MDSNNQERIGLLIEEFGIQRADLKNMIVDLEKIREKVDKLIPETLDSRFIRLLDEKVKSITDLFRVLLDIRKEIMKSLKEEIEVRRKDDLDNDDQDFDVRQVAREVEKLQRETSKITEKLEAGLEESTGEVIEQQLNA